ncbi:MAG: hypothetical protein WB783_03590 [Arenicellales bacterium]
MTGDKLTVVFDEADHSGFAPNCHRVDSGVVYSPLIEHIALSPLASRIRLVLLEDSDSGQELVYPIGLRGGFETWRLEENLADLAAKLERYPLMQVLLDYTWESGDAPDLFIRVEDALQETGLPPSRFTFLTMNPLAHIRYRNELSRRLDHVSYGLRVGGFSWMVFYSSVVFRRQLKVPSLLVSDHSVHDKRRSRKFLSLNRRPKAHRFALGAFLFARRHHTCGYISMPSLAYRSDYEPDPDIAALFPRSADNPVVRDALNAQDDFFHQLPWLLDRDIDNSGHIDSMLFDSVGEHFYRDSYLHFVTEAAMQSPADSFALSEKSCKPLVNYQPALVIGKPGVLAELRRLGFRTFPQLFDESYDSIDDPEIRLVCLLEQIDSLCASSLDRLHEIYRSITPDVEHNRNWMIDFPAHHAETIWRNLVKWFSFESNESDRLAEEVSRAWWLPGSVPVRAWGVERVAESRPPALMRNGKVITGLDPVESKLWEVIDGRSDFSVLARHPSVLQAGASRPGVPSAAMALSSLLFHRAITIKPRHALALNSGGPV